MIEVRQTDVFERWLDGLTDGQAASRIARRIVRLKYDLLWRCEAGRGGRIGTSNRLWSWLSAVFHATRGYLNSLAVWRRQANAATGYRESESPGGAIGELSWIQRGMRPAGRGFDPMTANQTDIQKPIETKPFDAARYLSSPEAQQELLDDAFASGNAGYIADALGVIARARGMTEVARTAGVTREALYKSLSEEGDPRLTTLLGVARALGVTLSARIGE